MAEAYRTGRAISGELDERHRLNAIRSFAWTAAIATYLLFPILSGVWFIDRIECIYMWPESMKQGLSAFAYIGIGMFAWRLLRPDVVTEDGALIGYFAAGFIGFGVLGNVLHKCW